jgi:intraflagellar transport protein 140
MLMQVRLLCGQEDYETAKRTALDAGDTAATFFLARRFEALGRVPEATELYIRARRPTFAAAYACRRGVMEEVQRLAMLCDNAGKVKYAEWLLAQNERGRAAALYQAAGAQVSFALSPLY